MKPITLVILGNIALVAAGIVIKSNALTKSKETGASVQPEILMLVDTTPITLDTAKELRAKSEPKILVDTTPITMDTVRALRAENARIEERELLREKKLLAEELAAFSRESEAAENQQQASSESTQALSEAEQTLRDLLESADDDPDRENKILTALLDMALEDPAAAWKLLNDEYAGEFDQYDREQLLLIWFDQDIDAASIIGFLEQLSEEERAEILPMATHAIASQMVIDDPLAALDWAGGLPENERREAQQATVSEWVQQDPESAEQWLSEQSNPDLQHRGSVLIAMNDPAADTYETLDNIGALASGEREQLLFQYYEQQVSTDRDTSIQWLQNTSAITLEEREMLIHITNDSSTDK